MTWPRLPHLSVVLIVVVACVLVVAIWWKYIALALVAVALYHAVRRAGRGS